MISKSGSNRSGLKCSDFGGEDGAKCLDRGRRPRVIGIWRGGGRQTECADGGGSSAICQHHSHPKPFHFLTQNVRERLATKRKNEENSWRKSMRIALDLVYRFGEN